LPQYIVNLNVDETYAKLKASLIERGCIIAAEEPPKQLTAKQGSLWGITPKTAKKTLTLSLQPAENKTVVEFSSKLASDWKNITLAGSVLACVLAAVCVWMALDLGAFLIGDNPSFWSWIVTVDGHVEFGAGEAFVSLAWGLAVFLSIIIALELAVYVYAHSKIETFAKEALSRLV
jgi:hypothetical protein